MERRQKRRLVEASAFLIIRSSAVIIGLALAVMLGFIIIYGAKAINWTFLTKPPIKVVTWSNILL